MRAAAFGLALYLAGLGGVVQQFRARTDLVTIDAQVLDAQGQPVRSLTAADFEVFEDGKSRPIQQLVEIQPERQPWPAVWMSHVRRDVISNRPLTGRLLALVLDDATMEPDPAVLSAAKSIARSVIADLSASDRLAVVFTRDSRGAQPFTNDPVRLLEAVDRLAPGMVGGGGVRQELTDSLYYVGTLATLQNVLSAMATTQHAPKAVIYIGPGVPIDWEKSSSALGSGGGRDPAILGVHAEYARRLSSVFRSASASNVAVHAIDPGGLQTESPFDDLQLRQRLDFLRDLSSGTGGIAIADTNDFQAGVARVAAATNAGYLIGYEPVSPGQQLRRIDVKVKRPGVQVRTRSHFEPAPARGDSASDADERAAMAGLLPQPGVPMDLTAVAVPISSRDECVIAVIAGVRHPAGGARAVESLGLTASAFDMEGKFRAGTRGKVRVQMSDTSGGRAEYEVYTRLQLKPGRYQLRLGIIHDTRGDTGSVFHDITVPDFTAAGLHMSDLLLDAGPARRAAGPSKLFADALPIQPTVQREFRSTDKVVAFTRLVQGGHGPMAPVGIASALVDAEGKVVETRTAEIPAAQFNRQRMADYQVGVVAGNLPPGWYLFRIAALIDGQTPVTRELVFQVTDGAH